MSWNRFFRRKNWDEERARELAAHLQIEADENISRGMVPQEARYAANRKLGNSLQIREEIYRMNSVSLMESAWQDVRQSLRSLWKNPRFTAISMLTLALGIGANTAAFSMVNALLLHPYNFANLDQLVLVWESRGADVSSDARKIAAADAADVAGATQVFDELATYREQSFNLSADGNVQPVFGGNVSTNFFRLLGVTPEMGRTFTADEQQPGQDLVMVASHGFWRRQLGGDPAAIGKQVQLNGRKYTVIGVMPKDFNYPQAMELWVPLALTPAEKSDRAQLSLLALGRLKSGVTITQARAALESFSIQLQQQYPRTSSGRITNLLQLRKELYSFTLPLFLMLQAAALFVLLLACANLASLLFARMIGRQREIAIRAALGASRGRLTQLYVCETLLLSLGAGLLAASISFWSVKVLRTSIPRGWTEWVPGWDGIQVNSTVLIFTILLSALVGICCGAAAVYHAGRVELNKTLKESGPGAMTRAKERLRSSLVVTQVTFALVLLVCAGLTIQGFRRLAHLYADRQPESVLKVRISLPKNSYANGAAISGFYQALLRDSAGLPGVTCAALVTNAPASNVDNLTSPFTIEDRPALRANETPEADLQTASPDYFRALRIPVVRGRTFSQADDVNTQRVAVITRSMATQYWPSGNEIGHRLKLGTPDSVEPWMTIVGVVEDVRQNWWNPPARPTIYEPFFQAPRGSMVFLVRASASPASYATPVRNVVKKIDAGIALSSLDSYENEVSTSLAIIRILGILLAVFGFVALALSSIGVYGVMLESVIQRTREMGIRVALGANPGDVMRLVLWQSLRLTGIGVAIGLPLSFLANRAMAKLVLGIVTLDFTMLASFAVLLAAVGVLAGFFPARRAMRVNPIVALRYE